VPLLMFVYFICKVNHECIINSVWVGFTLLFFNQSNHHAIIWFLLHSGSRRLGFLFLSILGLLKDIWEDVLSFISFISAFVISCSYHLSILSRVIITSTLKRNQITLMLIMLSVINIRLYKLVFINSKHVFYVLLLWRINLWVVKWSKTN